MEFIKQHYVRNEYLKNEILNDDYTIDAELKHFSEMVEIKTATIRKWKQRSGDSNVC